MDKTTRAASRPRAPGSSRRPRRAFRRARRGARPGRIDRIERIGRIERAVRVAILLRRYADARAKAPREIALVAKPDRVRDVGDAPRRMREQRLGKRDPPRGDEIGERAARLLADQVREVVRRQARRARGARERERVVRQVRADVAQHARERVAAARAVRAALGELRERPRVLRADEPDQLQQIAAQQRHRAERARAVGF